MPIVKTTNCILAPSYAEIPDDEPAQPCIRCGMCAEACPASLLPQQLFWYAQAQDHERLEAHNLFDCIECGACSYVCPSNIPLVQYYRAAKGEIRHAQDEKVKADHARERFEFHKERIEQAEREKEAKRAARREAALKAKANLPAADKTDGASGSKAESKPSSSAADIIAAAQARAAAKQASPEDQKAKLERTIAATEQRLIVAEEKLAEAIASDSDKQAIFSARRRKHPTETAAIKNQTRGADSIMAFKQVTSPHAHSAQSTSKVMQLVIWATVPGILALTWQFGWGSLINVVIASVTALICEAMVVKMRGRSVAFYLSDYSALVTALLLALSLPPLAPWWIIVVGTVFSIVVAKQLYGGLGYNPFNPAMVGYVVLLISFPIQMTTWVATTGAVARRYLPPWISRITADRLWQYQSRRRRHRRHPTGCV